jgi:hypothetical protein
MEECNARALEADWAVAFFAPKSKPSLLFIALHPSFLLTVLGHQQQSQTTRLKLQTLQPFFARLLRLEDTKQPTAALR